MPAPAAPGYEVKFLLDPAAVLAGDDPAPAAREFFRLKTDPPETIDMVFLDGRDLDLHTEHWNVRVRKKGSAAHPEVTFKRRYPVRGEPVQVLSVAARQGFGADETDYEAELEWGPANKTLGFNKDIELAGKALPTGRELWEAALTRLPGKLKHWIRDGWAVEVLTDARAHVFGPVRGRRWVGERADGGKLAFEVWPLRAGNGYDAATVVEASFKLKASEADAAAELQAGMLGKLKQRPGWLGPDDALKTEMILLRYQ